MTEKQFTGGWDKPKAILDHKLSDTHFRIYSAIGFVLIAAIMIANGVMQLKDLNTVARFQRESIQTTRAIEELDSVLAAALDSETGMRGYLVTGLSDYLEPFSNARGLAIVHLDRYRQLMIENQQALVHLPAIEATVVETLRYFDEIVHTARTQGIDVARKEVAKGHAKRLMDRCRVLINETKATVLEVISARTADAHSSAGSVKNSVVVAIGINLIMIGIAYLALRRFVGQNARERERLQRENWLKDGLATLNERFRSDQSLKGVCQATLEFLASYINISVGTFYVMQSDGLSLAASYALDGDVSAKPVIKMGQGLVGEAAANRQMIHLREVPKGYLHVSSSIGQAEPREIVILPLFHDNDLEGVLELGSTTSFDVETFKLLEYIREKLGVNVDGALSRAHLQMLLEETQAQSEELQSQQAELRASNEELEAQTMALKQTQERLRSQQEELRQTNEELEEQARILENQKITLLSKNQDLELAQTEIEKKAHELAEASRYKSEFLANMSHELRTPLNSMLILSTLLADNQEKTLSEKQVGFAKTIYRSGTDLLNLISDILDLAKVEAGKLSLFMEQVDLRNILTGLDQTFRFQAEDKGLSFQCEAVEGVPYQVTTDTQRLEQILKNFLSNSIKFTETGSIQIRLEPVANHVLLPNGQKADLAFAVTDTGIGIPKEKQELIFEAFQQADGSTSRQFGGTGLGLTISRELAAKLGGRITVESQPGVGSKFTLYLSLHPPTDAAKDESPQFARQLPGGKHPAGSHREVVTKPEVLERRAGQFLVFGDQAAVNPGDRLILIIDDDLTFGTAILEHAHAFGFKAIVAGDGESGLKVLEDYNVQGVILDLKLPDISGLSLLERIKDNPKTRHLPIHVISGSSRGRDTLKMGAIGYLVKPVSDKQLKQAFQRIESTFSKSIKHVLVVEDDQIQRDAITQLLRGQDVKIEAVGRGEEALQRLGRQSYDCMILDLRLPDISGFDLLEKMVQREDGHRLPVVVYTGKDLSTSEIDRLRKYSESIVIKGARSPERLLDEVSLFLHRVEAHLPADVRALLRDMRSQEQVFENRKILVVDDDMRNVFALSNALESHGMQVIVAKNGKEGVAKVESDPAIELVLMDIMMPIMDGYEAISHIRSQSRFQSLPIIALTAKAMKGDQERCIEAGANDYLAKPVDMDRLISLIRVWLPSRSQVML